MVLAFLKQSQCTLAVVTFSTSKAKLRTSFEGKLANANSLISTTRLSGLLI